MTVSTYDINQAALKAREGREWLALLQSQFTLHPAVEQAMKLTGISEAVLIQWPHRSLDDPKMLAYTRSEEHGVADRQTRTTPGKYLRAAFPGLKDNVLRDLVYEVEAKVSDGFKFVETSEEMVQAVQQGPYSCMQWDDGDDPHPYQCYAPRYGWSMAIRERNGEIVSRALVYAGDACSSDKGCYVRTYGDSGEADLLAAWLNEQGIERESSWPRGAKLAYIRNGREGLFPYIDGNRDRVNVNASAGYMTLSDSGEHTCNNSDGTAEYEDYEQCENCDDDMSEEDMNHVGPEGDTIVCDHCIRNYFTLVTGTRRREYYVHEEHAVEVDGEMYDADNPPKEIVCTRDGDNAWEEDCVLLRGEYYRTDDPRVIWCESEGEHLLCADAWQCAGTQKWYPRYVDPVEIDGEYFHEDDLPEGYAREGDSRFAGRPDGYGTEGALSNDNQEELSL
jgi:hypothetical protein